MASTEPITVMMETLQTIMKELKNQRKKETTMTEGIPRRTRTEVPAQQLRLKTGSTP
jgi:hypothetical protein